jgi:aspartokinase/homoserine dehydrogenase 1
MIVMKFGGSSVSTAARIRDVARIVRNKQKEDRRLAVVFSAFGGVTDDLIRMSRLAASKDMAYRQSFRKIRQRHQHAVQELGLARNRELNHFMDTCFTDLHDTVHGIYLVGELSPRTLDFVSGFGELLSARIIAAYFTRAGIRSAFLDARELIRTDESFGGAHVDFPVTHRAIRRKFRNVKGVGVITGFIASTSRNEMTTLGRGGSDYTAAIFGAALRAAKIEIWTDVTGVMTADPRKVRKAFTVPAMTYTEAMEMSHFGAKVIHPPTIQPALEKRIPLWIKNTFHPEQDGTYISTRSTGSDFMIRGISSIDTVSLVTVRGSGMVGVSGTSGRLFGALSAARINVILITQGSSEHSITFAVQPEDAARAQEAIGQTFRLELKARLIDEPVVENDLSIVAVIGENMKNTPGVSARLFESLGKNGISAVATAQGSSELNISVVIHASDLSKALNSIHQAFFLSGTKTLNIFLMGTGLIGGTLLKQIETQRAWLRAEHALEVRVVALANSRRMVFHEDGFSPSAYARLLREDGSKSTLDGFVQQMIAMNLSQSVFVDCTSNEDLAGHYEAILDRSISIVTPNKIANSGGYALYDRLKRTARRRNVRFLFETNVGAGLPVINTLNNLMQSGDRILKIEAVLSGTLSYIFNRYRPGMRFADVVREAQDKGFTEPDPRVDLSGKDVARKLLILAREAGLPMEMRQIDIEKILPPSCLRAPSIPAFYRELEKADGHFLRRLESAARKGKVLRFIATLQGGRASIALKEVDATHPFYNLSGSDNIISFTSARYRERPLVVKGPGAGAEVTAAGVFADIISLGNYFSA